MSGWPQLLPTGVQAETFGGVPDHIDGELVPVLTVGVSARPIYFEHHILRWKHPTVQISLQPMKGALPRMMPGMQVFVTEARREGMIAFSRDGAGHIVPIHLAQGRELHVCEHQFLAATDSIDYSFERGGARANMLFGGIGFFIDKFHRHAGDGILWLHGYGSVFEKALGPGEIIDIELGGWLYKDPSVRMKTAIGKPTRGLFGGFNLIVNRVAGAVGWEFSPCTSTTQLPSSRGLRPIRRSHPAETGRCRMVAKRRRRWGEQLL
jgi:uncharacterized protein (AIM24 family)